MLVEGYTAANPKGQSLFKHANVAVRRLELLVDADVSAQYLITPGTFNIGPPVPDHFYGFDTEHIFGPGANGSWVFSSDGGGAWRTTNNPGPIPHPDAAMIAINQPHPNHQRQLSPSDGGVDAEDAEASSKSASVSSATTFQTNGGSYHAINQSAWTLLTPRTYTLLPNNTGFTIHQSVDKDGVVQPNVTFTGCVLLKPLSSGICGALVCALLLLITAIPVRFAVALSICCS